MYPKNYHLRDMLMDCYGRAVGVALHSVMADDNELDRAMAEQSLQESYPLVEKLASPGIRQWIMDDLTKKGMSASEEQDIRYLLNDAAATMERGNISDRYASAKFILEFISHRYELQGFKFD